MSNVIKFYYSEPLFKETFTYNPYANAMAVISAEPLRRYTMAVIYDDSDSTIKFGLSICMPNDNFCKKIGQEIAIKNAMSKPFHVIKNFNGRRNDYADQVMEIFKDKEHSLYKKHYPQMFNPDNLFD